MELRQSRTGIIRRVENNIVRARSIDLPGPVPGPRPFVVIESGGALPISGLFCAERRTRALWRLLTCASVLLSAS